MGAWSMLGLTVVALAVAIAGDILSRTLVLDAVALWPLAALVVPALVVGIRGGRRRALAPLILLTWILVSVGLHLGRLEGLPSTAAAVEADLRGIVAARLTLSVPDIDLRVADGPSFAVRPLPVGGSAGPPVVERVSGTSAVALLVTDDAERSAWYRFGAYQLGLPPTATWDLRLDVSRVDLDLRSLTVRGGRVEAEGGSIRLGPAQGESILEVAGDVHVELPPDGPARVEGSATFPQDWTATDRGARSPADGAGWVIVVVSGTVRITTGAAP